MRRASEYSEPSIKRVALGLAAAPVVPTIPVAILGLATGGDVKQTLGFALFLGTFYGIGPAVIIGTPVYCIFRGLLRPTVWTSMIVGAVVASIPAAAAALVFTPFIVPVAAPLGAIGGLTFWLVTLRCLTGPNPSANLGCEPGEPPPRQNGSGESQSRYNSEIGQDRLE
jgi:hypothetical protein